MCVPQSGQIRAILPEKELLISPTGLLRQRGTDSMAVRIDGRFQARNARGAPLSSTKLIKMRKGLRQLFLAGGTMMPVPGAVRRPPETSSDSTSRTLCEPFGSYRAPRSTVPAVPRRSSQIARCNELQFELAHGPALRPWSSGAGNWRRKFLQSAIRAITLSTTIPRICAGGMIVAKY